MKQVSESASQRSAGVCCRAGIGIRWKTNGEDFPYSLNSLLITNTFLRMSERCTLSSKASKAIFVLILYLIMYRVKILLNLTSFVKKMFSPSKRREFDVEGVVRGGIVIISALCVAAAAILLVQASPFSREVNHAGSIVAAAVGFRGMPLVETKIRHRRVLASVPAESNIVQAQRCVKRGAKGKTYGCAYVVDSGGGSGVCQTSQIFLRNLTDVDFPSIRKVKESIGVCDSVNTSNASNCPTDACVWYDEYIEGSFSEADKITPDCVADPRQMFEETLQQVKNENPQLTNVIEMDTVCANLTSNTTCKDEQQSGSNVCKWDSTKAVIEVVNDTSVDGTTSNISKGNATVVRSIEVSRDREVACGVNASWQAFQLEQLVQGNLRNDQWDKFKDAFDKLAKAEETCKAKTSKNDCEIPCEYIDASKVCKVSLLFKAQQLLKLYGSALQIGAASKRNDTYNIAREMLEQAIQCNLETSNELFSDRTLFLNATKYMTISTTGGVAAAYFFCGILLSLQLERGITYTRYFATTIFVIICATVIGALFGLCIGAVPVVLISKIYSKIPYELRPEAAISLGVAQSILIVYFNLGRLR